HRNLFQQGEDRIPYRNVTRLQTCALPISANGMIRFQTLGGWWNQVMLAQRVQMITKEGIIPGVIASTPPHLLTPEQRKKPMEVKEMLIDIGADDREDAKKIGVEPGDAILPVCPFTPMANEKK